MDQEFINKIFNLVNDLQSKINEDKPKPQS